MHVHPSVAGYIAALISCLCFGSFSVPMKTDAVKSIDYDPLVWQTYKTFFVFISSIFVTSIHELTFTPWGLVSGLFWVPAGVTFIVGVRTAGLALTGAICCCVNLLVSFCWGILVFQERIKSFSSVCLALLMMTVGLVGMSIFGSSSPSSTTAKATKSVSSGISAATDEHSSGGINKSNNSNVNNIFRETPPPQKESFYDTLKVALFNIMAPLPSASTHNKTDTIELIPSNKVAASNDSDEDDTISPASAHHATSTTTEHLSIIKDNETNNNTTVVDDVEVGTTTTTTQISNSSRVNLSDVVDESNTKVAASPISEQFQLQLRMVNNSTAIEECSNVGGGEENDKYDRLKKPSKKAGSSSASSTGSRRKKRRRVVGGSSTADSNDNNNKNNAKGAHAFVKMLIRSVKKEYDISLTVRQMGLIVSSLGASWGASVMVPLKFAGKDCQGLKFVFSFAVGAVFATVLAWTLRFYYHYMYDAQTRHDYYKSFEALPSFHFRVMAVPGAMSGILWSIGNAGSILSVTHLGTGIGYCLVQSSMLVTGSWGIFYFHEITDKNAIRLWLSCACLTIAGILLLSYNHLPPIQDKIILKG